MSIETLSFVMIFCDGICIVTVRKDTRTICWMGTKTRVSPAPRTPSNLPRRNTTPTFVLSQYPNRAEDIQNYRERKNIGPIHARTLAHITMAVEHVRCRSWGAGQRIEDLWRQDEVEANGR
jgi:hypothetical protein